jgi:hypothetical protein
MKFFWTFFWTFLLVEMATYVVSSMIGIGFDATSGAIIAVVATLLIFIVPLILPNDPVEHH